MEKVATKEEAKATKEEREAKVELKEAAKEERRELERRSQLKAAAKAKEAQKEDAGTVADRISKVIVLIEPRTRSSR